MKKQQPLFFEIEDSWNRVLGDELQKPYMVELAAFVERERQGPISIYPPQELVFNALTKTSFDDVKVVVLGQDPYHNPGQAHGLSFSVPFGVPVPPSLKNIFKELESDVGAKPVKHGCLEVWAKQGVLLLNAIFTVRKNAPLSHQKKGWERFTDMIVKKILSRHQPVVFLLWGKYPQKKCIHFIEESMNGRYLVLTAAHPSPFSAHHGFLGCCHFSKANAFLVDQGLEPINWQLS